MNEWVQFFIDSIGIWGSICSIVAVVWIVWRYHIRIIRKKDDELASLRKQIKQAEPPEQKSSQDVWGTYEIFDAKNPQGKEYKGTLKIEEWREWLSCKWVNREWENAPKEINGIGLRVDKALAFSYKYTDPMKVDHTGVMLYDIMSDDHLSGKCVEINKLEINELEINEPHAGFEECKKQ